MLAGEGGHVLGGPVTGFVRDGAGDLDQDDRISLDETADALGSGHQDGTFITTAGSPTVIGTDHAQVARACRDESQSGSCRWPSDAFPASFASTKGSTISL